MSALAAANSRHLSQQSANSRNKRENCHSPPTLSSLPITDPSYPSTVAPSQQSAMARTTAQPRNIAGINDEERARIRERYAEKAKERRLRMYERALRLAEEREREEGRRHRARRVIQFRLNYETYYGQDVFVVGSVPALGFWDPQKAVPLRWCPGHVWSGDATVSVEDGNIEYKFITKDRNTGSVVWEPGFNHKVEVQNLSTPTTTIECAWGK